MPDKILLVDEQLYMLRLIEHHLEKAGYELLTARSTEEARAVMSESKPTLVVGDARALQDISAVPSIRVTDEPALDQKNPEQGPNGEIIFHKPFSPTQLVAQVKKLIPQPTPGGNPL